MEGVCLRFCRYVWDIRVAHTFRVLVALLHRDELFYFGGTASVGGARLRKVRDGVTPAPALEGRVRYSESTFRARTLLPVR